MTYPNGAASSDSVNLGSNPSPPATRTADVSGISRDPSELEQSELSEQKRTIGRTFPGTVRTIPLSRGLEAIVDAADYARLSAFRWHANVKRGDAYAARKVKVGKRKWAIVYMHHDVLAKEPGLDTDHINGNRLDNRRENLRTVTHAVNIANRANADKCGAFFCALTKRWAARVSFQGKRRYLGRFDTKDAALAAATAERSRLGIARPSREGWR